MVEVVPPSERHCERCGRQEEWDDDQFKWTIVTEDGEKRIGQPHCLHEWDINGSYNPLRD